MVTGLLEIAVTQGLSVCFNHCKILDRETMPEVSWK